MSSQEAEFLVIFCCVGVTVMALMIAWAAGIKFYICLAISSVLPVAVGIYFLAGATTGVGLLALGCYFGIIARIVQAAQSGKSNE